MRTDYSDTRESCVHMGCGLDVLGSIPDTSNEIPRFSIAVEQEITVLKELPVTKHHTNHMFFHNINVFIVYYLCILILPCHVVWFPQSDTNVYRC